MKFEVQKYLKTSTIHGLTYVSKRYHIIERIFWIIVLFCSSIYTSILIFEFVVKILNFPIVSYLSDQSVAVSEISFPAVTVCERLKFKIPLGPYSKQQRPLRYIKHTLQSFYYEFEEAAYEFFDERLFKLNYFEFLDRLENGSIKPEKLKMRTLKRLQVIDILTNRKVFHKLNFSIPTDDILDVMNEFEKEFFIGTLSLVIYWIDELQDYVSVILTQWGLCFTYNSAFSHDVLHINKTSEDFHYQTAFKRDISINNDIVLNRPLENLPQTISSSKAGLWIGFSLYRREIQKIINNTFEGYTVILHNPFELPSKNSKVIQLNVKHQTTILVDPQQNSIDESLVGYEPADRNCYLENEKILKFFKVYTKNNCENECLTDFILSRCGCVEFFMIRNSSTRICSANEQNCYKKAADEFEGYKSSCMCLPPCNYVNYNFEKLEYGFSNLKANFLFLSLGFRCHYKDNVFTELIRKKQFTIVDFWAFVGGILGLFAGFSALSFIELVYWFTIRVWLKKSKILVKRVHSEGDQQHQESKFEHFLKLYLRESSIHGLGYISEFSWITSILWAIFILTSMTFCIHMIQSTRESVPDSRVIALDDNFKMLYDIPFPAITVVPQFSHTITFLNSIMDAMWDGSSFLDDLDSQGFEKFKRDMTDYHFCEEIFNAYKIFYNFSFIPYVIPILKEKSQVDWFRQQFSTFNGRYQPEFVEIRTSRGMGFTFNVIDADEMFNFDQISSEFNYTRNITTQSETNAKLLKYPLKFNKNDRVMFSIKVFEPTGRIVSCVKQSFIIHQSDELPTFNPRLDFVGFEYQTTTDVIVTPTIIKTDKNLKILEPLVRECYFEGEKSLKFFKKYSQRNCELECFANITMENCGCVDMTMPFNNIEEICLNISKADSSCNKDLKFSLYTALSYSPEKNCSCLPLCNSISYNIKYFIKHEKKGNETTINVRMNMDDIILFRRYQQFTFSDVVSYVGGLLGLFAGISMLSIVEFFYFFTIRLGVNLWRIISQH